jgi:hypothetical protein
MTEAKLPKAKTSVGVVTMTNVMGSMFLWLE